jgi:putative peptidoglycan lipid II flippase
LFLAREEMRVPILAVALALLANILGVLWLRQDLPRLAPVWGVVIGAWTNALVLVLAAFGRLHLEPRTILRLGAILAATLVMGALVARLASELKGWIVPDLAFVIKGGVLVAICLAGAAVFMLLAWLLGAFRLETIRKLA